MQKQLDIVRRHTRETRSKSSARATEIERIAVIVHIDDDSIDAVELVVKCEMGSRQSRRFLLDIDEVFNSKISRHRTKPFEGLNKKIDRVRDTYSRKEIDLIGL